MRAHDVLVAALALARTLALVAAIPGFAAAQSAASDGSTIYGSQMMTDQERNEYRQRMRDATPEQRAQIRADHHRQMQDRARTMGLRMPDMPQNQGMGPGMGQNQGMGRGMGQGPGMGPGMGQGPGMGPGMGQGRGMGQGSR
jgi:hypothetical protein